MAISSKKCIPVWDKVIFNIGDVKPKEGYSFAFKYTGIIPIVQVESGCACTNVRLVKDLDGSVVTGMYTTPEFPPVLKDMGHTIVTGKQMSTLL